MSRNASRAAAVRCASRDECGGQGWLPQWPQESVCPARVVRSDPAHHRRNAAMFKFISWQFLINGYIIGRPISGRQGRTLVHI